MPLVQDRDQWQATVKMANKPSGSTKWENFTICDIFHLKKDLAPWSASQQLLTWQWCQIWSYDYLLTSSTC